MSANRTVMSANRTVMSANRTVMSANRAPTYRTPPAQRASALRAIRKVPTPP